MRTHVLSECARKMERAHLDLIEKRVVSRASVPLATHISIRSGESHVLRTNVFMSTDFDKQTRKSR